MTDPHDNGPRWGDAPDEEWDDYFEDSFAEEERPRPVSPLSRFPEWKHSRPALILFVLFYIASALYSNSPMGQNLWLSGEVLFAGHQYWRLFTSLAVHANMLHLLSNSLIFIIFGWMLRSYLGLMVFPVVSIVIGSITNAVTIYFYDPQIRLIGASGMVNGMVAFWLIYYIRYDVGRPVPVRIFRAVGFAVIMLFPTTFDPQTSYLSHAVGFAVGLAVGILLLPFVSVIEGAGSPAEEGHDDLLNT